MTHYLIDTHIFIWWMGKSKRLSKDIYALLDDPHSYIAVSIASVWEIVIKRSKQKLTVPKDIKGGIAKSGFILLPIAIQHVMEIEKLPLHHKDPFDRMLIAQAKTEKMILITDDVKMKKYDIRII